MMARFSGTTDGDYSWASFFLLGLFRKSDSAATELRLYRCSYIQYLFVLRKGKKCFLCERGAIPTLASNSKLHFCNGLQMPEEASASESASEIITGLRLNNYSGITRQSLAMTGFAARLV